MKLILPVKGYPISLGFGEVYGADVRGDGWDFSGKRHNGVDFACPLGTPVRASADGRVVFSGWDSTGYGNLIRIRHADGSETRYAHLSAFATLEGSFIGQGQVIGLSGASGNVTGAHLHWEYRTADGEAVDPMGFLAGSDFADDGTDENNENQSHSTELSVGETAKIAVQTANIRDSAFGSVIGQVQQGTAVEVLSEAQSAQGLNWRRVRAEFWVAEADWDGTRILEGTTESEGRYF